MRTPEQADGLANSEQEIPIHVSGLSESMVHYLANFQGTSARMTAYECLQIVEQNQNSYFEGPRARRQPYERRRDVATSGIIGYFEQVAQYENKICPGMVELLRQRPSTAGVIMVANFYTNEIEKAGGFMSGNEEPVKYSPLPVVINSTAEAFSRLRKVVTQFGSEPLSPDSVDERLGDIVCKFIYHACGGDTSSRPSTISFSQQM